MTPAELESLTQALLSAARDAAAFLRAGYRSRPRPSSKSAEADLVTEFDKASEALLTRVLAASLPGVPVVGEETASLPTSPLAGLAVYVDPLDGTTNFVHGHPCFSVSVGAAVDDEPIAGAIVAPVLGVEWHGFVSEARSASYRDGVPCRVSSTARLGDALVATGFPTKYDGSVPTNFAAFERVQRKARGVRRCGSAAIDLCFVADGTYDAYWERKLKPWDLVGGSALVRAAGGRVSSVGGTAPSWHEGSVLASNGAIHDLVVAELEPEG